MTCGDVKVAIKLHLFCNIFQKVDKTSIFPLFAQPAFPRWRCIKSYGRDTISLNAPTKIVFLISLVLAVLALLGAWVISIPVISGNAFLMMLLAYVVLAAGNILKGM